MGAAVARLAEQKGIMVCRATLEPEEEGVCPVDLGDRKSVEELAEKVKNPEAIILTASTSRGGVEAYERIFVKGCRNVVETFPASRVVMCSSTSVYEVTDGTQVTEEYTTEPKSDTVRLLREAEEIVLNAGGVVARLSNLYGPCRSVFMARILDESAILEVSGTKWVNHIHRDDAAAALLLLAHAPAAGGQVYNVSDDMPIPHKKLATAVALLVNKPAPEESTALLADRKRPWTNKAVVNTKLKELGWQAIYPSFLEAVPDLAPTMPGYEVRDIEDDDPDTEEDYSDDK